MDIDKVLNDKRSSQAAIGMTKKVFSKLLPLFEEATEECIPKNPYKGGRPQKLKSSRERLFFVMYYMKNYPTFDVLGMLFGMNRSSAFKRIAIYARALEYALKKADFLPPQTIRELNNEIGDTKLVIIDGTEQRRNRPKDKGKQKDYYSGKKNITR